MGLHDISVATVIIKGGDKCWGECKQIWTLPTGNNLYEENIEFLKKIQSTAIVRCNNCVLWHISEWIDSGSQKDVCSTMAIVEWSA